MLVVKYKRQGQALWVGGELWHNVEMMRTTSTMSIGQAPWFLGQWGWYTTFPKGNTWRVHSTRGPPYPSVGCVRSYNLTQAPPARLLPRWQSSRLPVRMPLRWWRPRGRGGCRTADPPAGPTPGGVDRGGKGVGGGVPV